MNSPDGTLTAGRARDERGLTCDTGRDWAARDDTGWTSHVDRAARVASVAPPGAAGP